MNLEIPKVGVAVLIKNEGRVLLGKRKNSHGEGLWAFPGGHLDFGETPEETARRETLEEVNLELENLRFITATNDLFPKENKHYITLFFEADLAGGELTLQEPDKCERWDWFKWEKLPEPLFPTLCSLKNQNYRPVFTKRNLGEGYSVSHARSEELPFIVELLREDKLGKTRENEKLSLPYTQAFGKIQRHSHHHLLVLKKEEEVLGTLQLNFLENLTFEGSLRAQFEGVRIKENLRGIGLGRRFLECALEIAQEAGAKIIQLTTHKEREESLLFYESLGFQKTHEGFKFYSEN